MSEIEEFEKWFTNNLSFCVNSNTPQLDAMVKAYFKKLWDFQQEIIKQQAAELSALRGFAQSVESIDFTRFNDSAFAQNFVRKTMKLHKLIDETGKPTKLLTGEE